jgi:hypothetical protein
MPITLGRNEPCHCGSKKKYKKCHLEADEKSDRKEREKAALNSAKIAADQEKSDEKSGDKNPSHHPDTKSNWIGKMANKVGFFRGVTQRRTGPSSKGG